MTNFLYILQCLQSYFPETLSVLYLHKAPWILQQAWHLVKWLLDPVVRAKVQFTNYPEELMKEIPPEHLLKYIGGEVDVEFNWVPPEEGENSLQDEKEERKRRWDNHRRLCNEFEQVTRHWVATEGKEGSEARRVLVKKLRVSHFDYEPYWQGMWVHHRNGDLSMKNPGMIRWQYPYADGKKIRQVLGHESSRKTLVRELQEIAAGAPVDFAEARTRDMLKDGSWGQWDSCEDLPAPPTGFQDGKLLHDNELAAAAGLIDVIGLNGPETIDEAKKQAPEQQPARAVNAVPVRGKPSSAVEKGTTSGAAAAVETNGKGSGKAKPAAAGVSDYGGDQQEKVGFFGSLKKRIVA